MVYSSEQPWPKGGDGVRRRVPFLARGFELDRDDAGVRRRRRLAAAFLTTGVVVMAAVGLFEMPSDGAAALAGAVFLLAGFWFLTGSRYRRVPVDEDAELICYDDCVIVYMPDRVVVDARGRSQSRWRTFECVARRDVEGIRRDASRRVVEIVGRSCAARSRVLDDGSVLDESFVSERRAADRPVTIRVRAAEEAAVVDALRTYLDVGSDRVWLS